MFLSSSALYQMLKEEFWAELKPVHGARGMQGLPWVSIAPLALTLAGDPWH